MISASKPASGTGRKPFFGEWPAAVGPMLLLLAGLACLAVFYITVFAAAHAVAAQFGARPDQFGMVSLAVCALFLLQGLVPLVRFSVNDLPRLAVAGLKIRTTDLVWMALLVAAGIFLLFG